MKVWKNKKGVSPVIATILMVAITVVLAAVLYVMVMGMMSGPGNTPKSVGLVAHLSADGTTWTVDVTSVSGDIYNNKIVPAIINKDGTRNLTVTIYYNSTTAAIANGAPTTWPKASLTGKVTGGYYFQFLADANMDKFQLSDDQGIVGSCKLG
jgi:flagellin-like protein